MIARTRVEGSEQMRHSATRSCVRGPRAASIAAARIDTGKQAAARVGIRRWLGVACLHDIGAGMASEDLVQGSLTSSVTRVAVLRGRWAGLRTLARVQYNVIVVYAVERAVCIGFVQYSL